MEQSACSLYKNAANDNFIRLKKLILFYFFMGKLYWYAKNIDFL